MKLILPQISLHTNDAGKNVRVLSLDVDNASGALVSGGADCSVKMWKIENESPCLKFVCEITTHSKSVNIVRFSPNGKYLATASDDGLIFLFETTGKPWSEVSNPKELVKRTVRGHASDIYAFAWSPDSTGFVSGSIDSTSILWKVSENKDPVIVESFRNHCHFVQGLAFHPSATQFISQSSDRSCKLYNMKNIKLRDIFQKQDIFEEMRPILPKFKTDLVKPKYCFQHDISKREFIKQSSDSNTPITSKTRMFVDDSLPSFFRRLAYSPDGSLLVVPAGKFKSSDKKEEPENCCYVFSCTDITKPACCLTGFNKAPVCVSFCPLKFKKREMNSSEKLLDAEYRFIFCVLTLKDIIIYDTQAGKPIAIIEDVHYAQLTDAAWLIEDKRIKLFVSSSDGYISIVKLHISEIGELYEDILVNNTKTLDFAKVIEATYKREELIPVLLKATKKRRLKPGKVVSTEEKKADSATDNAKDKPSVASPPKIRRVALTQISK